MDSAGANIIPVLFKVLFGFIIINMVVTLILLYTKQMKIYKILSVYWPVLMVVYIMQSIFQTGFLPITLAYSINIISCSLFAMVGFEAIGRKFPVKKYILYFIPFYPLTILLANSGFGFTTIAMPFGIATATPLVHAFIYIFIVDRKRTTRLQKLLAFLFLFQAIHCINFALFRMVPDAQIWGWLVAYALYDLAAILMPAIALEEASISENSRLQKEVDNRTAELHKSNKENESLLKVVLHDLSSPLMTLRFYLHYLRPNSGSETLLENAKKSQSAMEKIILEVKNRYGLQNKKLKAHLNPVGIEECFNDVSFMFAPKLAKKNISLIFTNQLSPNTKIMADQTTLTHSVLSNLVSNGLKFSSPNSKIHVSAKEVNNQVVLEVEDQGPGIPEDVIKGIFNENDIESSTGSMGETGSGYGLSIVKSFVDSYGGQIEFDSKLLLTHPQEHGTKIRITLDRA